VMTPRRSRRAVFLASLVALALLALAASASASTIKLKCGGPGPRNQDSAGTALCAAEPGKARVVTGKVRDDSGKPVSTKVTVTFITWDPQGEGSFALHDGATKTIVSKADGSFSLPVKTETRLNLRFNVGDEAKSVGAAQAEAQVSRRLGYEIDKLGGGRVKFTVVGAGKYALKLYILDESGYELAGVPAKKANRAGSAVFNLGNRHGNFSYYAEIAEVEDLFWEERRPTFHL
jgi:hypothetical protein